jgi:hypothetical protein
MNYEKRVCCFIDILGFKQHLSETINPDGTDNIDKINSIISIIDFTKHITGGFDFSNTRTVTYFSDSLVISYEYNEKSQLFWTLLNLQYISMELANKGFLVRGGVAIGKLIHNEQIIFGPALVDAYKIESEISIFPRIIVDNKVIEEGVKYRSNHNTEQEEELYIKDIITKDFDDVYYIDYIQKISSELDNSEMGLYYYIVKLKTNFFKADSKNKKVNQKLGWLKTKINELISNIKNNIKNSDFSPETIESYSELDEIK